MGTKSDSILFDGKVRRRKRIILLTGGCTLATCTMCPFPGESQAGVRDQDLIAQFEAAFTEDNLDNYELVTLFCNGNFFSDRELGPAVREHIFGRISRSRAGLVAVESLPQFLSEEKVNSARRQLGTKKLAVFMGLQSADDWVREVAINTTCSRKAFEKAVTLLQANDYLPVAFLMVKPPFLTEEEAIADTLASIAYLARLGLSHSTLCPTRIAPQTLLWRIHEAGYYQPAWVWSVVEILRRNADAGGSLPMVNTSELKDFMNPSSTCAHGCPHCKERLISSVEKFLFARDLTLLESLTCNCYADYLRFKEAESRRWREIPWENRVQSFLHSLQSDLSQGQPVD